MKHRIRLRTVVVDCADAHELANFYSHLLGWPITATEPDWVLLRDPNGGTGLSFQAEEDYHPPVWKEDSGQPGRMDGQGASLAKMLRLDFLVEDLEASLHRALHCGASLAAEQLFPNMRVLLDPAGHPFCLFTDQDFDWDIE